MDKKVLYMCPHCYYLSSEKDFIHDCDSELDNETDELTRVEKCSIEIDANIAPIIASLNKLGYKTTFCCEGHADASDGYSISEAYITFDKDLSLDAIEELSSYFKMWEFDKDDYIYSGILRLHVPSTMQYDNRLDIDSFKIAFEYYKKLYLLDLAEGIKYLAPIKYMEKISARPIVSDVSMSKDKITIKSRVYLANESSRKYNSIKIGDAVLIKAEDESIAAYVFNITKIEIVESLFIDITAESEHAESFSYPYQFDVSNSIVSIEDMIRELHGKQMLFKSLGDSVLEEGKKYVR